MDGNRLDCDGARGAGAVAVAIALSFSVTLAVSVTIAFTLAVSVAVSTSRGAVLAWVLEEPPQRFQSVVRRGRGFGSE
jgi:hypothetical protein